MEKILSIIIPTYNMEALLRHTLDSLLVSDENMKRLEVLIINDGSKDSSLAIAQEYETKYPDTFRAIDKPNGNYGSCVNKGMELATGKYVKVLDADDCFDTENFELYISYLSKLDCDLIISDFDIVNENWEVESDFTFNLPTDREFTLNDIPGNMVEWLWHHGIAYKTSVVRSINYKQTEGISYTDDEWVFEPMMCVRSVIYFPHSVYKYLRGREGQTFDPKVIKRTLEQRIKVAYSMVNFYKVTKSCMPEYSKQFMTSKLVKRLRALYNYHIIKYLTDENLNRIIEFDNYLKVSTPDIYESINSLKNNYGWHYIRQWRNMNYSKYAPALLFVRIKRNALSILGDHGVKIDIQPQNIKRRKI